MKQVFPPAGFRSVASFLAIGGLVVGLSACSPRVDPRGNMPDPERLAEIQPGEHTRMEVMEILGSPSTIGNFKGETWFYISKRTETVAFFEPEVTERHVVVLHFDNEGVVSKIQNLSKDDGHEVLPVERVTPSEGNQITLMEQLLGNFGRFNKDK